MISDLRTCLIVIPVLASCSPYALDQGDTLSLSFGPGLVYVSTTPPPAIADFEASERSCQEAGGAVVYLRGTAINGQFAEGITVTAWVDSGTEGQLIPIKDSNNPEQSSGAVNVLLDEQGTGQACFRPGSSKGNVTIKARSGVVETSNTLMVSDRVVPVDGTLTLTTTNPDAYLSAAASAGACGLMTEGTCSPGRARRVHIAITATAPQGGGDVPEGATVILTSDKGWLTLTNDCVANDAHWPQTLALKDNAATTSLCLDDTGGTATVTAKSGTVTATKSIQVSALPAAMVLTPSTSSVKAGGTLTLSAYAHSCDGKGIAGVPVSITIESGMMTFETPQDPIQITDENGKVSVTGTATQGPISVRASLSTIPSIECAKTIEVKP